MKRVLFTIISLILLAAVYYAQQENTDNDKRIDIRRTETSQLLRTGYNKPKEEVFPLGYGTNHLGRVSTGTGVWTELNPKVPRVDYIGIDFINPDTGWTCGGSGTIIKQ